MDVSVVAVIGEYYDDDRTDGQNYEQHDDSDDNGG